jgi:spore germination protein KC
MKTMEQTLLSSIRDFLTGIVQNQDAAATYLSFGKAPLISEQDKISPWSGINGAALFSSNKMVGTINIKQAKIFAWIKNRIQRSEFLITIPSKKLPINFELSKFKSATRPFSRNNNIHYHMDMSAIAEIKSGSIDLNGLKETEYRKFKKGTFESIEENAKTTD